MNKNKKQKKQLQNNTFIKKNKSASFEVREKYHKKD